MKKLNVYLKVYLGVALICFVFLAKKGGAQTLSWTTAVKYDNGVDSALAVHSSGLVLEVHQTHVIGGSTLWYHVGKMSSTGVTWGKSHELDWQGEWPNFALTDDGYVIFVYSTGVYKSNSSLYYAVGKIDPDGDTDQTITWLTKQLFWDKGFHSSTTVNQNGTILSVHESGSGGKGLYYRVGHLKNPSGKDYSIVWDSGTNGVKYDDGINPHIALNNHDEVVEVHQVTNEELLHYRRGIVSAGRISFGSSYRYDDKAMNPSVTLLDSGLVIETHATRGAINNPLFRVGNLNLSNLETITWSDSLPISDKDSVAGGHPAIAANGTNAVVTWTSMAESLTGRLYSSLTSLP